MATASVMMTDIWASSNNQAGLGYLERPAAGIYYENRLNVKGLSLQSATFAFPVNSTVIGLNYRYFGFSSYIESKFGLAVGRKLGEKFSMGVQMDVFHTHYSGDYGNVAAICGEIGLMYEPAENIIIGAHLFNVTNSKQKVNMNERMPTIMRFGIGYKIQDYAIISVETEKDLRMKAIFKGGLEFSPVENLFLRCGVSSGDLYQYSFGLGYGWKFFTIDVSFSHHKFLGYIPHVSLNVNW